MTAFLACLPPVISAGLNNLKRGQRVRHVDYGPATITKINRRTGAVTVRLDDGGHEGTATLYSLRRLDREIAR